MMGDGKKSFPNNIKLDQHSSSLPKLKDHKHSLRPETIVLVKSLKSIQ